MPHLDSQWTMEVLVTLFEYKFETSPSWLADELHKFRTCYQSTYILEKGFNNCRARAKLNPKNVISPTGVWYELAAGCKHMESFERPVVPHGPGIRCSRLESGSELCKAKETSCSLPPAFCEPLTHAKVDWPLMSILSIKLAPMAFQGLMQEKGDVEKLNLAFLSLLAAPGFVVMHGVEKKALLVLNSCRFGCTMWPMTTHRHNEEYYLRPGTAASFLAASMRFVAITDPSKWKAVPIEIALPKWTAEVPAASGCFHFKATQKAEPLMKHAAKNGFRGMNVEFLKKLFAFLQVPYAGRKPCTEMDLLAHLIKHVLKPCSEKLLNDSVSKRLAPNVGDEFQGHSILWEETGINLVDDCPDEDAVDEDITAEFARLEQVESARLARERAAQEATARALSGEPSPAPPRTCRVPAFLPNITVEEGCRYLPSGYTLTLNENGPFPRWYVKKGRWIRSRNAGPVTGDTVGSALRFVLLLAWTNEREINGTACPYVFEE